MRIAYFVGGCLGAIAFSNFLKILTRIIPAFDIAGGIILAIILVIGGAIALFLVEDTEEGLKAWFLCFCALFAGVMLGGI